MSVAQSDVQFFINNTCFSYDPRTQNEEEERLHYATQLADAEDVLMQAMRAGDVSVWWRDEERMDDEPDAVEDVESCVIEIEIDGEIVASLSVIWDADMSYRRVIRAELALECLDKLRAVLEAA